MTALLLLACSDHGLSLRIQDPLNGEARIDVDPEEVDFFAGQAGEVLTRTVTVTNVGTAILLVDDVTLDGSEAFGTDAPGSFSIEVGQSVAFEVSFTPLEPYAVEGVLSLVSNDDERPVVEVDLRGEGLTPWLLITPDNHVFDDAPLGCPDEVELLLQNVGLDVLVVDGLEATGDPSFDYLSDDVFPLTLSPGAFTRMDAVWTPGVSGAVDGEVSVISNDPRGVVRATQTGTGLEVETVEEVFAVEEGPPVDLLFAVDQSCSMDDDAEQLAANFSTFVDALNGQTWRWRMGVVTWDHACVNGGPLKPGTPDLVTVFGDAVVDGDDLDIDDDEALLKMASRALAQTGAGDCNEGLVRSGAPLHVIVVSDEPERSTEQASAWTWDHWLDEIRDDQPDKTVTVHGVVDADDCNDGDDGYAEAIAATGGQHLSICEDDWAGHVAALAESVLNTLWVFELSQTPALSSVVVAVDGTETINWSWDSAANAVTVHEPLEDGQEVRIAYAVQAPCD